MHDITDNRYAGVPRSYGGEPLWKGSHWQQATGIWGARVNIGWMNSIQDQVIALADFSARNDIEIGSADHEYEQLFGANPELSDEMMRVLGDRFFCTAAHWAFLSLVGREPPFHFPCYTPPRRFEHECAAVVDEIYPTAESARPMPRIVQTSTVRWAYAAVMACRPDPRAPAGARTSIRLRVHVERAPIGIGLLNADQSDFLERRRVAPATELQTVFLPIADLKAAGPVVIHTWDAPESARVRLEDVAFVW
jgi:hypothetical protein